MTIAYVRRNNNMARKKMSKEESKDWEKLYFYVKDNIMGYDENQALSKNMVLRLKGLLTGKFIENKNIKDNSSYSYETILATFKYCRPDIEKAFRTKSFQDESHKFNYALVVVEKNINTVYVKMKNIEKAKEAARNATVEMPTHIGAEFKPREKKENKFSNLW